MTDICTSLRQKGQKPKNFHEKHQNSQHLPFHPKTLYCLIVLTRAGMNGPSNQAPPTHNLLTFFVMFDILRQIVKKSIN